ncbi:LysE family translocator [Cocleimonas flava]|uniref:Threonine/homoserine/homoserine lactone efflux protein n=1 Tax=Cocleimonas flava TaxID=634765 RepID=A0A4R1F4Z7_9GAMM|nr:LysE family translocator [Cocleimonas flava]TCJ87742.1 threonine/homoserine/homoserine lactone efflux protein [Cocleimonas flava]
MEFSSWLLFVAVAIAAVMSPGPAILLAISNSVRFGLSKVFLSTLGNVSGLFLLSIAAIFGLGAVLKTSTTLFLIVKVIGAAYLIYLGVKQWRTKANFFDGTIPQTSVVKPKSIKRYYLEGFFIAMTNPKAILFFTALFPQFLNTQESLSMQFFIMTLTLMLMSFIALMTYGLLASKAKRWFAEGERTKWFNRVLGSVFISIGIGVLQLKIER